MASRPTATRILIAVTLYGKHSESGEVNLMISTHHVKINNQSCVMRRYGSKIDFFIDRDVEQENQRRLESVGLAPKLLGINKEQRVEFFEYIPGRAASEDDFRDQNILSKIVRSILSIHSSEITLVTQLNPFRKIEKYELEAKRVNPSKMENQGIERIHQEVREIEKRIVRLDRPRSLCHNDLNPGNFIMTPTGTVRIIDWEFAAMGDPLFDLANFLSTLRAPSTDFLDEAGERNVLNTYFEKKGGREIVYLYELVARYLGVLWAIILEKGSDTNFDYVGYSNAHMQICLELMGSANAPTHP